ncbi:unnamed protein product [Rhizoctonia solani]|uniref:Tethering factor for nuclear proteasome STS1 n=1 Tax=Rhizoctonia solani TaxID=456999 RepID=A0A8H3I3T0_9AGAM|nr:unnamed protein product [Rhizoctonia solani]
MSAPHLLPQQPIHVPFRSAPVTHAPSPFGFGFGLSSQASTSSMAPQYNALSAFGQHHSHQNSPATSHHPFSNGTPTRVVASSTARPNGKRRYDESGDGESREDSNMNTRSPSPDRPRRTVTKRIRATEAAKTKTDEAQDTHNIDVGVLLASLPSESLLPLLTSLINSQPNLKPLVLSLIPQPSVQTAIQALDASAKVLKDTYPYSQAQPTRSTSFGFGSSFGAAASLHAPSSTSFGFRTNPSPSGAMREDYIRSRIRPSVAEFTSTATSYLSYFSLVPSPQAPAPKFTRSSLHDSFAYLCALTVHVMRAPPLARALLLENPVLFPRLNQEWNAWIDCLDVEVNKNAGMFSAEAVREWERSLDELTKEGPSVGQVGNMQPVRDKWIEKVGWMVGRTVPRGTSHHSTAQTPSTHPEPDLGLDMAEEDEEL